MIPTRPVDASWTEEQWKAIYEEGHNIIVSAGAGSGKTAVLTERIIEKLKRGVSVSSLVVLTFTKAAAFEMKTRVRKKITKEIEKGNVFLQKELDLLNQADITTFDSYSLSLVKKYHYLLNIPQTIEIADAVILNKVKRQIMDRIFDSFYDEENPLFLNLLDTFTLKDDEKIKNICIRLSASLDTLVHKEEYLQTYMEKYFNDIWIDEKVTEYEFLLKQKKEYLLLVLEEMKDQISDPLMFTYFGKLNAVLKNLLEAEDYNQYKESFPIKLPLLPRSKKIDEDEILLIKTYHEQVKDILKEIEEMCVEENKALLKESILKTKDTTDIIIQILERFEKELFCYKKMENKFEFADIARLAILLLENHPEICEEMKQNINEIMIDEYQDTNDIGDYFISLISDHNVYMVGDIKQSIYRFRNANPSIFMDKYNRYKNHIDGEAIDLNKNFRSRREVLEDINFLFEKIMDEQMGGADYQNGHAMVFGNQNYETKGNTKTNHHLEILDYEYLKTELSKKYRPEEIEAFIIAFDIKKRIESKEQVFDKDNNILRDICYRDFCILLDRKTSFDLYKKIFTYLEIPLTIHKDEEFVYSDEIFVVENIMRWIYSYLDKEYEKEYLPYAVMSIARSMIGQIQDEELFVLFTDYKKNIRKELENKENPLYELNQKMLYLATFAKTHTLSEVLEETYQIFDIYHAVLKLQNIEKLHMKLDYLLDVTRNLEKMGYQIQDFIDYLEEAKVGDSDITFSLNQSSENNSVNLMTIHKSKGLEYHICYYAGLQKKFSQADLREKFLYDVKLGILTPFYEEGIKETFYKHLMKYHYRLEDIAERIRVFYVALTRAKEKMIMVTNLSDKDMDKKKDKNGLVDLSIRLCYRSFYDIILSLKNDLKPYIIPVSLEEIPLTKAYEKLKETNYQEQLQKSNEQLDYIQITLEKKKIEQNHFSESYHLIDPEEQERMELGVKLHECLQYVDYSHIEDCINNMNLTSFEKRKIQAFFEQPFFRNLKEPEFYQELEFIDKKDNKEQHGIIDLLIIDSDMAYVIDYKLKNIDKDSYIKQVQGYMEVVEKRLHKPVRGILYSLFDEIYKMVEK